MKPDTTMNKFFYIAGWIFIFFLVIVALIIHVKGKQILEVFPPCLFNRITGLYCPGCGGTRAVFCFFRGEIIRSFKFNPIVPYTFIIGGWFMLSHTIEIISKGRVKIGLNYRNIYLWIALAIVVVNFLIKNLYILVGGIHLLN